MGCLVSGAGYRNPGAAGQDGDGPRPRDRAVGRSWGSGRAGSSREHRAFGFDVPAARARRIDRLRGRRRDLLAACSTAIDRHPRRRVVLGRRGPQRSAARPAAAPAGDRRQRREVGRCGSSPQYADIWNADGDDPESFSRRSAILDEHCRAVGRDPASIERTAGLPPPCIRPTPRRGGRCADRDPRAAGDADADAARRMAEGSPVRGHGRRGRR